MSIGADLRSFVINNFLLGRGETLSDDDSFLEQGIIDSTGILELVAYLEETYGIEITEAELIPDNLDSINRITAYLNRKLSRSGTETPALTVASLWRDRFAHREEDSAHERR